MSKSKLLTALTAAVIGAAMVVSFSGCDASARRGSLSLGVMEPINPDPALTQTGEGMWVDTLLYSGLLKFDENMHVVPDLAVALPTPSVNGLVYQFTIRSDAKFADGQKVKASDVEASFVRALSSSEASPPAWRALGNIDGARAVRNGTTTTLAGVTAHGGQGLTIRLQRPDYSFLDRLAMPAASILDRAVIRSKRNWWRHGAGTGPFEFSSTGSLTDLVSNPHYYGGPMKVGSVHLVHVASIEHEYALYQHRRLDATAVPPAHYASASTKPGFSSTDTGKAYYVDASGLSSRSERLALDQSLDRSSLSRPASYFDPLSTVVPPVVPDYPASSDPNQYDPAVARTALAHVTPIDVTMPDGMAATDLGSWLQKSWSSPNRTVRFRPGGSVRVFSSSQVLPDPDLWLTVAGDSLVAGSDRKKYRGMLATANGIEGTDNVLAQYGAFNRAEEFLLRNALIIPLGVQERGYLISPRVSGLWATPIGLAPQNLNWSSVTVG